MRSQHLAEGVRDAQVSVLARLRTVWAETKSERAQDIDEGKTCRSALRVDVKAHRTRQHSMLRLYIAVVEAEIVGAQFVQSGWIEGMRVGAVENLGVRRVDHPESWKRSTQKGQTLRKGSRLENAGTPQRIVLAHVIVSANHTLVLSAGIRRRETIKTHGGFYRSDSRAPGRPGHVGRRHEFVHQVGSDRIEA